MRATFTTFYGKIKERKPDNSEKKYVKKTPPKLSF